MVYIMFRRLLNKEFIINAAYPICKNCVYFQPHNGSTPMDLAKCTKYGKKDVITGKVTYSFASVCRTDQDKCGNNGVDWQSVSKGITH